MYTSSDSHLLGEALRLRREALGLSLRSLAEQVDLSASFISQIERNESSPSIASLHRLATALKTTLPALLRREVQGKDFLITRRATLEPNVQSNRCLPLNLTGNGRLLGRHVRLEKHMVFMLPQEEMLVYLLEGHLTAHLAGNTFSLAAGDSIYAPAANERSVHTLEEPARFLITTLTPSPVTN